MQPAPDRHRHRLAAILFADIVGYSDLSSRDHGAALRLVDAFQSAARDAGGANDGRVVKFLGDGALLEFSSSAGAVRAAAAIRQGFGDATDPSAHLRIGIHVGEVAAAEDGDLYGDGVNVAARLQQAADPGAVWVSEDVWRQLRAHREFRFVSCGDHELRGQAGPIRAYRLESEPESAARSTSGKPAADRVIESLAVLPFVNMSADPEQEYFSDGISEELLDAFAKVRPLRVAARTSSFQFKGMSLDVREVGRKLGVAAVLEGSVRKAGNRVRITAQLIETRDGFHLWSDRYDRTLDDVFAVQEEIAQAIVGALQVRLPGGSRKIVRQGTEDVEAYNLYLRGRHSAELGGETGQRQAVELYERAIALDPHFAGAYAGLADGWLALCNSDFATRAEALPIARAAVERALALDDGLGEAHVSLGQLLREENDWEGSERHLQLGVERSPSFAPGHIALAMKRIIEGRLNEALEILRHAATLDPLSRRVAGNLAFVHLLRGDFQAAVDAARETVALAPGHGVSHGYLAVALAEIGEPDRALDHIQRAIDLTPGYAGMWSDLAWIHAATGDREAALEALAKARADGARPAEMAQPWMRLGETERALACLDEIDTMPTSNYTSLRASVFAPVRDDPRYRRVFESVGLSPDPRD